MPVTFVSAAQRVTLSAVNHGVVGGRAEVNTLAYRRLPG